MTINISDADRDQVRARLGVEADEDAFFGAVEYSDAMGATTGTLATGPMIAIVGAPPPPSPPPPPMITIVGLPMIAVTMTTSPEVQDSLQSSWR